MDKEERKIDLGFDFQAELFILVCESINFMLLAKKHIKPSYFSSEKFEFFINSCYEYYDQYEKLPNITFLKSISRDRKDLSFIKLIFIKKRIANINEDFIRDKVEDFVKRSKFIDAYTRSGELYNKNDSDPNIAYDYMQTNMEKINLISFRSDEYNYLFKDFNKRLVRRDRDIINKKTFKIKTGIKELDYLFRGGPKGGEVCMWMGDAKAGKSTALIHVGLAAVKRYIPTLHFQLEGIETEIEDKYDAAYSISSVDDVVSNLLPDGITEKMRRISRQRRSGKKDLITKNYVGFTKCTILDIERDFLELRGRGFDAKLVIIDYMDLMESRTPIRDERFRQQSIVRDIKTFATKYNVVIWTATQANRGSDTKDDDPNSVLTGKSIAEDYGKIRAIDHLITINATKSEIKRNAARLWVDISRGYESKELYFITRAMNVGVFYVPHGYKIIEYKDGKYRMEKILKRTRTKRGIKERRITKSKR